MWPFLFGPDTHLYCIIFPTRPTYTLLENNHTFLCCFSNFLQSSRNPILAWVPATKVSQHLIFNQSLLSSGLKFGHLIKNYLDLKKSWLKYFGKPFLLKSFEFGNDKKVFQITTMLPQNHRSWSTTMPISPRHVLRSLSGELVAVAWFQQRLIADLRLGQSVCVWWLNLIAILSVFAHFPSAACPILKRCHGPLLWSVTQRKEVWP